MLNRTLLRIKVIQILYSYFKSGSDSLETVDKELFFSLNKTHELYHLFFLLILDIRNFSYKKIEQRKSKRLPSEEDLNPNMRFVDSLFLQQLENNIMLKKFVETKKIGWIEHENVVKELYASIISSDQYKIYMEQEEVTLQDDKKLWSYIIKHIFSTNELLGEILEEMSIYWNDDSEVTLSFVVKTIKKFEEENGNKQALMPLFKDDEDPEYVKQLLHKTILNADKYKKIIDTHAKNWDADRFAFMDMVIIETAMTEILEMDNIPVKVTLNEYIEIAKFYSTDKSAVFINGILDAISTAKEN